MMAESGWAMSKPLEAERISQVEMWMCHKAIQLSCCELEPTLSDTRRRPFAVRARKVRGFAERDNHHREL